MPIENIGKQVFIDSAGAAVRPELKQCFQALCAGCLAERRLVPRQAAQNAQGFDPCQHAVFSCLAPDIRSGKLGARRHMVLDQICRTSGKRVLRQKILHRLPEEDWRMQINRFVAGKPRLRV